MRKFERPDPFHDNGKNPLVNSAPDKGRGMCVGNINYIQNYNSISSIH